MLLSFFIVCFIPCWFLPWIFFHFICAEVISCTAVFWLCTRWCSFRIWYFSLMASATPLLPLRAQSDNPDIWRVSIRFLGDSEVPPSVISHGTIEASPASSLHDLAQGIEHEGCLTSAVHGIQITAYKCTYILLYDSTASGR